MASEKSSFELEVGKDSSNLWFRLGILANDARSFGQQTPTMIHGRWRQNAMGHIRTKQTAALGRLCLVKACLRDANPLLHVAPVCHLDTPSLRSGRSASWRVDEPSQANAISNVEKPGMTAAM